MLILIVKSFGSTNKGVDRVHNKYIIIKRIHVHMYPEYTEEYINYKLTYSHSKLANFTIIMNKWTVLKLLQNYEFLLSKNLLYTNYNVN
jgi:hypothetical protein